MIEEPEPTGGTMKDPSILKHIIWASVVLALGVISAATWLLNHGHDIAALLALVNIVAVPVLIALGSRLAGKLDKVDQNSNGNLTRILGLFAQTHPQVSSEMARQIMAQATAQTGDGLTASPPVQQQDMPRAA